MTYATVIQIGQCIRCFHTVVFFRMIEPSRTDGYVTFCGYLLVAVGMAILQFTIFGVTRINFSGTEKRPVGSSCKSVFVTYPTAARTSIREDNSLWLQLVDQLIGSRIIVISFAVDSTAVFCSAIPAVSAIGTVKPDFKNITIVG